jgi:hypothetical protein
MNLLSENIDRIKELMFTEEWIDLDDIQIDDVAVDGELGEEEGDAPSSPAMNTWETGLNRGVANPVAVGKWSDLYQPQRDKGNPLW